MVRVKKLKELIQRPKIADGFLLIILIGAIFLDEHVMVQRPLAQALGAEDRLEEYMPLIIIIAALERVGVIMFLIRVLELDQLATTSAPGIAADQHRWLFGEA